MVTEGDLAVTNIPLDSLTQTAPTVLPIFTIGTTGQKDSLRKTEAELLGATLIFYTAHSTA